MLYWIFVVIILKGLIQTFILVSIINYILTWLKITNLNTSIEDWMENENIIQQVADGVWQHDNMILRL